MGISSHSHQVLRRAIESGEFDTVQLKYSVFNLRNEELIRLAHRKDIGVIVMKPLGGFGMAGALKTSPYWDRLNAEDAPPLRPLQPPPVGGHTRHALPQGGGGERGPCPHL